MKEKKKRGMKDASPRTGYRMSAAITLESPLLQDTHPEKDRKIGGCHMPAYTLQDSVLVSVCIVYPYG